jgi:hypothetical protein
MAFSGGLSASGRLGWLIRTVGNLAVLLIAMWWQIEVFDSDFGVHSRALLGVLVLGWMSQTVQCVLEAPRRANQGRLAQDAWDLAIAVAGLAPWILVPILFATHPEAPIWQSAPIPLVARGLGAVLALGLVLAPSGLGEPLRHGPGPTALTVQSQLLLISTLLVSGSPVFALWTMYLLALILVSRVLQSLVGAAPRGVACEHL